MQTRRRASGGITGLGSWYLSRLGHPSPTALAGTPGRSLYFARPPDGGGVILSTWRPGVPAGFLRPMTPHRLTGDLKTMSLPDLLQCAGRAGKTGALALRRDQLQKRILFLEGAIVGSSSNDPRDTLGQVLLSEGVITETQLKEALKEQKRSG